MLRKRIPDLIFILLLIGLLWSRALLSIITGFGAIYSFLQLMKKKDFNFKNDLLIWSVAPLLIWLLGAWQAPLKSFNYDLFLTLSAYPSSILIFQNYSQDEKALWPKYWIITVLISLLYPMIYFIGNITKAIQLYGSGQTLPSFMDNDHVRYSIFLCSGLLLLIFQELFKPKIQKTIFFLVFSFVLFLSVRTGWVILFVFFLLSPLYFLMGRTKIISLKRIGILAILFAFGFLGLFIFPTVQNKIGYTIWEWKQYKSDSFNINYSDGTRRHLNETAWNSIINKHESNLGWSGISASLTNSLHNRFPNEKNEFGWPFNQWLFWWMGAGIMGMILFSIWLCYPIYYGWKNKIPGLIFWSIAIILSCLVETNLNYQFGVFLHVWPLAFLWKKSPTSINDNF